MSNIVTEAEAEIGAGFTTAKNFFSALFAKPTSAAAVDPHPVSVAAGNVLSQIEHDIVAAIEKAEDGAEAVTIAFVNSVLLSRLGPLGALAQTPVDTGIAALEAKVKALEEQLAAKLPGWTPVA